VRRIVLTVDGSTPPAAAVSAVARVADPAAVVMLLHVHEVDAGEAPEVDERVESFGLRLQDAGFRVLQIRSHTLPHTVAADIAEVAGEVAADLVVIGNGRNAPLTEALFGSVSEDVLRTTRCPVLVWR
jgi:nucleotide-binding universal stress UspA family protein